VRCSYTQKCVNCYFYSKQFAKARATLDQALALAPADPRIQESRALVDKLAAQGM